jgi:hypothetical protein
MKLLVQLPRMPTQNSADPLGFCHIKPPLVILAISVFRLVFP